MRHEDPYDLLAGGKQQREPLLTGGEQKRAPLLAGGEQRGHALLAHGRQRGKPLLAGGEQRGAGLLFGGEQRGSDATAYREVGPSGSRTVPTRSRSRCPPHGRQREHVHDRAANGAAPASHRPRVSEHRRG
jgi:hypothetical protein